MTIPYTPPRGLQILKTGLYVLAGLVLVAGLLLGISLVSGASNMVANLVMPLQLLGAEIINSLITPIISGFLINLGIITIVLSLILSALLYALGRLVGQSLQLEARLAQLEALAAASS